MTIERIDPTTDRRWQAFIQTHREAGIFHTPEWLRALRRTYGYEPVAYAAASPDDGFSSGIPFCTIKSRLTGRRLVSLPFSDHCQPLAAGTDELRELLAAAKNDARESGCKYVEIRPLAAGDACAVEAADLHESHRAFIHRLDLSVGEENVFRNAHKSCVQRKIARSERERFRYEEGRSEDLLHKFYRLLLLTRRRHQIPPQPLSWFRNLNDCMGERLKIKLLSLGDTPAASIIMLSFKNTVTYKYGCSDSRFNPLGATVLLLWRTIQDAIRAGATEFDLGRSDHDTPGLVAFKDHWGAQRYGLTYYRYPGSSSGSPHRIPGAAKHLLTALPDPVFTALGWALYRHVG